MTLQLSGVALGRLAFDDDMVTRAQLDVAQRRLEFDVASAVLLDPATPRAANGIRVLDDRPTMALWRVRVIIAGWQRLTIREFDHDDEQWFSSDVFDLREIEWFSAEKRVIEIVGVADGTGRSKHVDLDGPALRAQATAEYA